MHLKTMVAIAGKLKMSACVSAVALMAAMPAHAMDFKEVLAHAYEYNPALRSEMEQTHATSETIDQAFSAFRPTVEIQMEKGRQRLNVDHAGRSYGDVDSRSLRVSQPLFTGGQGWYGVKSSQSRLKAQLERLTGTEQQVLVEAAVAIADLVRDREVLRLSANNEKVLKKQLEATQERFDVGEVTRTDVSQSQARASLATADRLSAEAEVKISEAEFERVVRTGAPAELSLDMPDLDLPESLEAAIDMALAANPTLKQAEHLEESQASTVSATRGQLLPSLSLEGSISRDDSDNAYGSRFIENETVIVNLNIPLYQAGAVHSQLEQAKFEHESQKFEVKDTYNRTVEAVITSWEQWQSSKATIEATRDAIAAARTALDGVKQEQLYGARTTLDVLDAEQELFEAEVNLVRAERNERVAQFNLAALTSQFTAESLELAVSEQFDKDGYYQDRKYQILGF